MIGPGGIFSSTEIQIGGAPAGGTAANPLLPGVLAAMLTPPALPVMAPTQNALMAASKIKGADFCPLCEACKNGLCLPKGMTA